jgi:hypothetical protein
MPNATVPPASAYRPAGRRPSARPLAGPGSPELYRKEARPHGRLPRGAPRTRLSPRAPSGRVSTDPRPIHTYLGAQYRQLAARRGAKRAAVAVAHSILAIAYHLLTIGEVYADLGPNYFDERARDAVQRRLVRRLEALGYTVQLQRPAA